MKQRDKAIKTLEIKVAPFTGARVETVVSSTTDSASMVAPFTGARVETIWAMVGNLRLSGRSLHGSES